MKVFIGGSRKISKLNRKVTQALDRLVKKGSTIIIGDANGADKAVQSYLANKRYRDVIVFCMQNKCRNNLGDWQSKPIAAGYRNNGFAFYAVKDSVMAEQADYGFMLWDAKSKGTLNNIVNLLRGRKSVTVYVSSDKTIYQLNELKDLSQILEKCDSESMRIFERDLDLSDLVFQTALWAGETGSDDYSTQAQFKGLK